MRRVIAHRRVRVTGLIAWSECCFHGAKMIRCSLCLMSLRHSQRRVCVNVVVDLTVRVMSVCDI